METKKDLILEYSALRVAMFEMGMEMTKNNHPSFDDFVKKLFIALACTNRVRFLMVELGEEVDGVDTLLDMLNGMKSELVEPLRK